MDPLALRAATLADVDALVRHRRLMWQDIGGYTPQQLDEADPVYRTWLRARLQAGDLAGFLVEDAGRPVASGLVWVQVIQPRPTRPECTQPYILSMYTDPAYRGRQVAKRVVAALVAWCEERGFPRVALHASPMGRDIYAKLGFERTWEMKAELGGKD